MNDFLDDIDTPEKAANKFRMKLKKFLAYLKHIESLPEHERTLKEKELVAKFGKNK